MRQTSEWLELYRRRQSSGQGSCAIDEEANLKRYVGCWVQWSTVKEGQVLDQLDPGWVVVDHNGQHVSVAVDCLLAIHHEAPQTI